MVNPEDLKVCVYTICKNEEMFAERWLLSAQEADGIFVNDTGSTDKTAEILKSHPKVHLIHGKVCGENFRFDYAWNEVLATIPEEYDFCVRLDMDMMFTSGWCKTFKSIAAKVISKDFFNVITNNIYFNFRVIPISLNNENKQKKHFWANLAHSFSKNLKYYGAVHENPVINNFKEVRNLRIKPKLICVLHTEKDETLEKSNFYESLAKKRFYSCPTYLNYSLYLCCSRIDCTIDILSLVDELLKEVSNDTNLTLTRFESSLKIFSDQYFGRLYILYLSLLKNFFIDKNQNRVNDIIYEIKNMSLNAVEIGEKGYFNNCVTNIFNVLVKNFNYSKEELKSYSDNIESLKSYQLYNYMIETFSTIK